MTNKLTNIIIVETSEIIFEGVSSILAKTGKQFNLHRVSSLCELEQSGIRIKAGLVLVNPLLIQNQLKFFQSLKNDLPDVHWLGIVYSYADSVVLSAFDEIVNINDSPDKIITSIEKLLKSDHQISGHFQNQENLSERENDVLKLLVTGNANKEIADKLNISIHTVISHRKNISQKTGIKSVSGLTIYAVVNNIISIDSYRE